MARKRKATITGTQVRPTNATLLLGTLQIQGTPPEVYAILGNFLGTAGGTITTGTGTPAPIAIAQTGAKRGRKKMSAAQRQNLAAAQKARWAKIRAAKNKGKTMAATA